MPHHPIVYLLASRRATCCIDKSHRPIVAMLFTVFTLTLCLSACQSWQYKTWLNQGTLTEQWVQSPWHRHRIFFPVLSAPTAHASVERARTSAPEYKELILIYLEGDGQSWLTTRQVAPDPTPTDPLMLALMQQSASANYTSLYISRPCYFHVNDPHCDAFYWTFGRYHPRVVDSLRWVIEHQTHAAQQLVLIGHSGGGTLATLLAAKLQRQVAVLTLAANLDTDSWSSYHAYTPLVASRNPITQALPHNVRQLHWYGRRDRNTLPQWHSNYCQTHPEARCVAVDTNHTDWENHWPAILQASLAWLLAKPSH